MTSGDALFVPLQLGDLVPEGSRVVVFEIIFQWFLILGTLVGIVVIGYMLWNAYKFRATGGEDKYSDERPEIGEIPQGGGKGRKLFLSFGMSAVIVISLIVWTYGAVLYVEQPARQVAQDQGTGDPVEIKVVGFQFGWEFHYVNYDTQTNRLVIPTDRPIALTITSRDVFHNFGIPEFRVKADAIPGETTDAWFIAQETLETQAKCFELCGAGHSGMISPVEAVDQAEWERWKSENLEGNESATQSTEIDTDGSRLTESATLRRVPAHDVTVSPRIQGGI